MTNKIEIEKTNKSCIDYYDNANQDYYDKYFDELDKKPYDKYFSKYLITLINKNDKILDAGCCSKTQQANKHI